jgi:hypothetical protein
MACSLHHTGSFSIKNSSINIEQGEDGYYISLKAIPGCDTCEGEGQNNYQCLNYCYRAKGALYDFIINQGNRGDVE